MPQSPAPQPEDLFIERYMPGASAAEREDARQNIRNLVAVLVQIDVRLAREAINLDSPENEECDRVRVPPV